MTQAARGRSSWLVSRGPFFPVLIILLAYLLIGALYASETPAWQAPDEPAHYNYVRQLAEGTLPVIEPSDYDERYRSEAVSSGFSVDYPIEPITYEDWQQIRPAICHRAAELRRLAAASLLFAANALLRVIRWRSSPIAPDIVDAGSRYHPGDIYACPFFVA